MGIVFVILWFLLDKSLNLDSLLIQLRPIEDHYKQFGMVAGVPTDVLGEIESSCEKDYDALVEVCDRWLRKCRDEKVTPSWRIVAEILSLIGQYQLSHDLLDVYKTGKNCYIFSCIVLVSITANDLDFIDIHSKISSKNLLPDNNTIHDMYNKTLFHVSAIARN